MNPPDKASDVPSSPWKRPKIVSLSKTNSLKRKSELFHSASSNSLGGNNGSASGSGLLNDENSSLLGSPKSAKTRKTVLNKFSVNSLNNSSPSFPSLETSNSYAPEKSDLRSFFGQNSSVKFDLGPAEEDDSNGSEKDKTPAVNTDAFKDFTRADISKICFGLGNFPRASTGLEEPPIEAEPVKKYLFQDELLIPMDWSLKTKCRFMSKKPFSCSTALKSSHEYRAVRNFCKHDHFYENLNQHQFNTAKENDDLFKTLFCESLSYWMAPFLPWMNLYPRSTSTGFSNLSTMAHPLSPEIQQSIFDTWNASFKSLSYGLRNGDCPYFYFLTHSFMVLFRAENVGDIDEIHAILTPSTKGLRDSLSANHIVFTMPLMPNNSDSRRSMETCDGNTLPSLAETESDERSNFESGTTGEESQQAVEDADQNDEENGDENQEEDGEEDTDEWLKQQGLNSVNLKPSVLKRNSKNAQKETIQSLDSRPKSTLFFRGGETLGLFNFLLNSKTCMTNSGPMAGIPPTLISPVPFMGGVVQKFKVDQNVIKSRSATGESLTHYTLDFNGPLMPFHIHRLCNLFSHTQSGEFEMVANTLYHTEAFNCLKPEQPQATLPVNPQLGQSEANSLQKLYGIYGKVEAIKTIKHDEGVYSCNEITS